MAVRPPSLLTNLGRGQSALDLLEHEIAGEMASALGRAGRKAEVAVTALRDFDGTKEERTRLVIEAARAVHAYFIQRELCGFRRHQDVIREYGIPREVLARLGAA